MEDDNAALRYVHTMDCPSGNIQRWLGTLADFGAGLKHNNADALSQYAAPEPPDDVKTQHSCKALPWYTTGWNATGLQTESNAARSGM